mmetsp:Transcript_29012/g.52842  ORF Transcript_29012/g.52842 Transcript_29012/m.52842 type:complete len:139 (+) Transcript_29012:78-494(+)
MAYMGANSVTRFVDRTLRAKSEPRVHINNVVTFDSPWRPGTPVDGRVSRQDYAATKDGSIRYTVKTIPVGRTGGREVAGLRSAQLHVHGPTEQGDHPYLVDPSPRLRAALALRDYLQWRDEGPRVGLKARRGNAWSLP